MTVVSRKARPTRECTTVEERQEGRVSFLLFRRLMIMDAPTAFA
jgi:hypothetical protein